MEIFDIGVSDLDPISFSFKDSDNNSGSSSKPSVNFGPGIELLMNDKKKSSSSGGGMSMDLGELDRLESELNNLSSNTAGSGGGGGGGFSSMFGGGGETKTLSGFASNLFNFGGSDNNTSSVKQNVDMREESDSNLGHATADSMGSTKTWDGYSKLGEVPLGGAAPIRMSERDRRRKKRAMIKKLEECYEKGQTKNNSHFTMDSPYDEIEDEYEGMMEDKRKKDSVKLQGWWFMTFINSIEYANAAFNPFDLNLDGWGEQVGDDIESYEEIFSELHEKYKGGKLSPEISLLLRLGFSAAVVNITNKALSTATPGFNDVIRQSPELMKMFTNATVQSMNQQSPGFEFANNILHPDEKVKTSFGPPPAPVATQGQAPPHRPGMNYTQAPGNRPDIAMGRGTMFRESGVDVNNNYENVIHQERSVRQPPPKMPAAETMQGQRQEMRGPQDNEINNLLTRLKTREVNIHGSSSSQNISAQMDENDSMVSISSLKDIQNTSMPKRTHRKQKSDKNTVSLDI